MQESCHIQEKSQNNNIVNYIPHHGVVNPNKSGKFLIVFDAAAKFKNTSLNENLLTGPDLLYNLVTVLCRFRLGKYGVIADTEKIFHQVKMKPADQNALWFVWRDAEVSDIEDYVMNVHLFGKTDSPCCENWTLRESSKRSSVDTCKAVKDNFYMDDYLDSMDKEVNAIKICNELISTLAENGFRLTKWLSNSTAILNSLPSTETKVSINLDLDELPIERALGMLWNPNTDRFHFKSILKDSPNTKRGILSLISTIFDPLGTVIPCTLEGKLIMQKLWQLKTDWDSPIPSDVKKRWHNWKAELSNLTKISIPRWFHSSKENDVLHELHIFAEASSVAYGAVSYIRTIIPDSTNVSFVMGKSRIE